MPLKHHTETAFILLLGFGMCMTGFLLALLPDVPDGLLYCFALLVVTVLYPAVLLPLFRRNRADYEFRFLHWFPACMVLAWLVLQLLATHFLLATIVLFGFTYLWALPPVVFGFTLLVLFVVHVIRRRAMRISSLLALLGIFIVAGVSTELLGGNTVLAHIMFPQTPISRTVAAHYRRLLASDSLLPVISTAPTATASGTIAVFRDFNVQLPDGGRYLVEQRERIARQRLQTSTKHLPRSGPEDAGVLALTLLGVYCGIVHYRAKRRVVSRIDSML